MPHGGQGFVDRFGFADRFVGRGTHLAQEAVALEGRHDLAQDLADLLVRIGVGLVREELTEPQSRIFKPVAEKELEVFAILSRHALLTRLAFEEFKEQEEPDAGVAAREAEEIAVCLGDRLVVPFRLVEANAFRVHHQRPTEHLLEERGKRLTVPHHSQERPLVIRLVEIRRLQEDIKRRPHQLRRRIPLFNQSFEFHLGSFS